MKYIALSDLHLGQTGKDKFGEVSLLSFQSNLPEANQKIEHLADIMNDFGKKDKLTMILVGDVLDLSLSYMNTAFQDFVDLIAKLPEVKEMVYVVGNHDHHLWTLHCEHKNVISKLYNGELPNKGSVYSPTGLCGEDFTLLHRYFNKCLFKATIAYPMYKLPLFSKYSIYFTHGHLFGGLYTFMSEILKPFIYSNSYMNTTSTTNVAIIEFIYWLLGETGQGMGADGIIEAIYTDTQKGKKSLLYKSIDSAVNVLLKDGVINNFPNSWERFLVKWIGKRVVDEVVKKPRKITSMDRYSSVETNRELSSKWIDNTIEKNEIIHLVSGHTHISDEFSIDSGQVKLYNLGSWLRDENNPEPDSNVLLIDGSKIELKKVE